MPQGLRALRARALDMHFLMTVAEKLARYFRNIDNLANASFDELMSAPEVGEKIAQSVFVSQSSMMLTSVFTIARAFTEKTPGSHSRSASLHSRRCAAIFFALSRTLRDTTATAPPSRPAHPHPPRR